MASMGVGQKGRAVNGTIQSLRCERFIFQCHELSHEQNSYIMRIVRMFSFLTISGRSSE